MLPVRVPIDAVDVKLIDGYVTNSVRRVIQEQQAVSNGFSVLNRPPR